MNNELYSQLVRYLADGVVPQGDELTKWKRSIFRTARRNFEYENGELLKINRNQQRRLVIPEHRKQQTLSLAHDHHLSGHQGIDRTFTSLAQQVWWPYMIEDVKLYIRNCDICQKRKPNRSHVPLQPSVTPQLPFQHIGIDIVGPLPRTLMGKRYVVVAIDWFTKWPEAQAIEVADAQTITQFIHERLICQHGVPRQLTSDRGTEFCNELIEQLNRTFEIQHIRTTAYHPQGNGLTERMNQTIKNTLSKLAGTITNWDHYLPSALFAIRTSRQEATTFSPFELVYGRLPRKQFEIPEEDYKESHEDRIWSYIIKDMDRLQAVREKAQRFIKRAQDRQLAKQHQQDDTKMNIGDLVLLYRNIVEASWSAKLEPRWEGPYYIARIKGTSIWLRKPQGTILPNPVHKSKLKKYHVLSNEATY